MKRKSHKFAELLPHPSGDEYTALREDVDKHGVQVPIVIFNDEILDGRGRDRAARETGRPCPVRKFEGSERSALEYVASLNLYRRHLAPSQRAIVAAMLANELHKMNGGSAVAAREQAAQMTHASVGYVKKAQSIVKHKSKLKHKILNGEITIGELYKRPEKVCRCPKCGHEWSD